MAHTAVFLMNLGGPRSLAEVEPYLYELFSDPLVVTAPFGPLRPLFAKLVSRTRAPSSAEKYALIGGQVAHRRGDRGAGPRARAGARAGVDLPPRDALRPPEHRGGRPRGARRGRRPRRRVPALPAVRERDDAVVAARAAARLAEATGRSPRSAPGTTTRATSTRRPPRCARRSRASRAADRDRVLVVFSAHGLPMSQVRKGDPYPGYIEHSARETARRAGATAFQVTYQSRVGPTKWLGPDTVEFLERNAKDRVVVAVPIAFVSEHLETLYDLDILAKAAAGKGGARGFFRVPALGVRPDFVAAMADVVRKGAAAQPAWSQQAG